MDRGTLTAMIVSLSEMYSWSKGTINRMGDAIRDGDAFDEGLYTDWILWHTELIGLVEGVVQAELDDFLEEVAGQPMYLYGFDKDSDLILSSRVKTVDTTREKLQRQTTNLARIRDIAGLRVDGGFTLAGQDLIADKLVEALLAAGASRVDKRNHRESPHSGYRAVHLHVKAPAGLLEIQIRTLSQSHWANLYETVGDLLGREIRYMDSAHGPAADVVSKLWKFSAEAYGTEKAWASAQEIARRVHVLTESSAMRDDQLVQADQFFASMSDIQQQLGRLIAEQVAYFAQQRGSLEKLRDTPSQEERS